MTTNAAFLLIAPLTPAERIETIDILRGFALFGILVVNMAAFMHPGFLALLPLDSQLPVWDRVAHGLVLFLAQGKFISLFSLLFGLGVAIQFNRGQERGRRVVPTYLRRLLVLFLIGWAHAFLVWSGDVLMLYAVAGLLLILFRNAQTKTIRRWAIGILVSLVCLLSLSFLLMELSFRADPQAAADFISGTNEAQAFWEAESRRAYVIYTDGTYADSIVQRMHEYSLMLGSLLGFIPQLLAMFLIGFLIGRSRLFEQVENYRPLFKRSLFWCLGIGFICSGISTTLILNGFISVTPNPWSYVMVIAGLISYPALCLFYLCAITLLCQEAVWRRRMRFFAPVGRLSLTNYLLQSVICTLIFNGYGLGFYGQGGAAVGVLLSISIYTLQVWLSIWWSGRFKYGPAEWMWRSLTYLKMQSMRIELEDASSGSGVDVLKPASGL